MAGNSRSPNSQTNQSAGGPQPPLTLLFAELFPQFGGRLNSLDLTRRPEPTISIGGRTYREIDNGIANVLVPIGDPTVSPAELAERRRTAERVAYMVDNPLAGVGYGLASMANASTRVRDQAMLAGGALNAAMFGAAPRAAPPVGVPPRKTQLPVKPYQRPSTRMSELNGLGQSTLVGATVTQATLGQGTKAKYSLKPPGWLGDGNEFNQARGHLSAKEHGGTGRDMRNLMTLTHHGANTPQMRAFERRVSQRVRAGEVMETLTFPFYTPGILAPSAVLLTAFGSRGSPIARLIQNPAGRRK
ncbi:DNA/RNA non-specific endonuclease [Phenylobacterium sp.]|uniref:DNA/RNA non-specific endonuclease n=1 Tax=Phenylobacterium sp. TaxID=1871053 RepID=UPI0027365CE7|nr:DNA/RNA non-specific endonuclease [Phenylobacterium sp.]MDP3660847.1 DNA/RNA non-specific endonuclease [Phenylobacterium sp.]